MIAARSPLENALVWGLIGGTIGAAVGAIVGLGRWLAHKQYQKQRSAQAGDRGPAAAAGPPAPSTQAATGQARNVAVGREVLISLAGIFACLAFMVIILLWAAVTRSKPPAALMMILLVTFVGGAIWGMVSALVFVSRRGRDRCPKCRKVRQYYTADRGLTVQCKRCGHIWAAGDAASFFW